MHRLLTLLLILSLSLASLACGNVFIRGVINTQTVSGTVSIVQLTFTSDPSGSQVQVTAVTLLSTGMASSAMFCGDQRSRFPLNTFVQASFTPGQPCANLVTVVIGSK